MVFSEAAGQWLLGQLRRWLAAEPGLEVRLGVLSSRVVARKLALDAAALNASLVSASTPAVFEVAAVREVELVASPWAAPALAATARGVDVTLALREPAVKKRPCCKDLVAAEKKRVIASIDPQGALLHDIIEIAVSSLEDKLVSIFSNVVLSCSRVLLEDVQIKVHYLDDSHVFVLKTSDLRFGPEFVFRSSLFRGLVSSFMSSRRKNSLFAICTDFYFLLKENDRVDCITSFKGVFASVRFDNLQLASFGIHVSHTHWKFSPDAIPSIMVILDIASQKEDGELRNGRELWSIAAHKFGNSTVGRKFSLSKVISMAALWQRYVLAYMLLLSSVGYPSDKIMKRNCCWFSSSRKSLETIRNHWNTVSGLEEKIPAQAIARARCVARSKVLASEPTKQESSRTLLVVSLLKILSLILSFWRFLSYLCWSALSILMLTHEERKSPVHMLFGMSEDSDAEVQFSLHLGELCVTLLPFADNVAGRGRCNSRNKIYHINLPSVCLIMKSMCLLYSADCTTKSLSFVVGELNTRLSGVPKWLPADSDTMPKRNLSFGTAESTKGTGSKIILWSDSASLNHFSGRLADDSSSPLDYSSTAVLESIMEELSSKWMKISSLYNELGVMHSERPFVIFEFKSFVVDPYGSINGFQQCRFTAGKLNLDLGGYFCTLSMYLLLREFQHYNQLAGRFRRVEQLSDCRPVDVEPDSGVLHRLRAFACRMKIVMLNIIPDNAIQIGALVAGLDIRLMLERDHFFNNGKDASIPIFNGQSCIVATLAYIECAIWPSSKVLPTAPDANSSVKESLNKSTLLKELQAADPREANRSNKHVFSGHIALDSCLRVAGLTVLVDNLEVDKQSHIFGPMSANFQLSTCRENFHSLPAVINVLSIALRGGIIGAVSFFYMDELFAIFQVIQSMHLVELTYDLSYSQDFVRRLASFHNKITKRSTPELAYIAHKIMIDEDTKFMVDMALDLESIDIIFNFSRDKLFTNSALVVNSAINYISMSSAFVGVATEEMLNVLALGIGFSIKSSSVKLLRDGDHTNFLIDFSGIQSAIFENNAQLSICNDILQYKTMLSSSLNSMYQFILSKCVFRLTVGSDEDNANGGERENESHGSNCSSGEVHSLGTSALAPGTIHYFLVEFEFGEVYMGDSSLYIRLTEVNKPCKQKISLFICDDFQKVKCKIQGGLIFLESSTLSKFVFCCKMYVLLLTNLPSWALSVSPDICTKDGKTLTSKGSPSVVTRELSREGEISAVCTGPHTERKESQLNAVMDLDVDLSQFSLTLAAADGPGTFQGLTLEVDTSLQLLNFGTKILFDLKRLSVSTNNMPKVVPEPSRDVQLPRFRSSKLVALPSQDEIQEFIHPPVVTADSMPSHGSDAHSISSSTSTLESSTGSTSFEISSHGSYILRHLSSCVKIERKNLDRDASLVQLSGDWFGTGSVSGLELTMTVANMQMISTLFAPLYGMLNGTTPQEAKQSGDTTNQRRPDNLDYNIPDGAIVTILDLNQQMYVAVEDADSKYRVVGAYHYSLAGERSLFKVRHHRRWMSEPCISLVSLYAMTDEGRELSLNFCRGSDFVEISPITDKPYSLWSTFPLVPDNFEDNGDDGKSFKIVSKHAYHLVNKKNNCGIAFVDGLLEFVKKPGNPFEVKVFNESLVRDIARLTLPDVNMDDTIDLNVDGEFYAESGRLRSDASLQHVNITVDRIVFTVLHEVFDTNAVVPLVQKCISDVHVSVQIFPSKIRILSLFKISGKYFNAQRNLWENLLSPITSYVFFRSRFHSQDSATGYSRIPVRYFFCLKQVDLFINELSLDILLYLAGKLDLMGPYAVRSSAILPNCCKIRNNSILSLVCHFQNGEDVIVPGKQSASVFLRHLALESKLPPSESVVSVSLVKQGTFSTYPINISLEDSSIFAWKTRLSSLRDSRSFSGPSVVVEVSKNSEEALSLSVSPLLRIYNKCDFPLELRFQRPHEAKEESAFVTLWSGEMIDESAGVFDAMDLSGGSKRALMSLALGNFLLSVRPEISEHSEKFVQLVSVEWSQDITGEKASRISGVLERLNYNLRRAFGVGSMKSLFSTLSCPVFVDGQCATNLHFLIHTLGRDVPLQPPNGSRVSDRTTPVAVHFQREIFIYPTVQVYNFLQTDIHVIFSENQLDNRREDEFGIIGKQAVIASGSSAYFYVDPAMFNCSVILISYASKSKPVNSSDWVRTLHKQKAQARFLDMELEFYPGKYHASLRLLRTEKGLLEIALFTKYMLHNTSEYPLLCTATSQKSLSWYESGKDCVNLPPELGCILPCKSMSSLFTKSSKVRITLLNERASEASIDLEVVSGFTELFLEIQDDIIRHRIAAFGVSLQPVHCDLPVPSQVVLIVPRYVISNESRSLIAVRQCFVEDDTDAMTVEAKQRVTLQTRKPRKKREGNSFTSFLKKHRNVSEDSHIFIQFCPKEIGYSCSGPICVSAIGRFFLKFRRLQGMQTNESRATSQDGKLNQFASVDVVQETATFVLHFNRPPNVALPYRIENRLQEASVMYFQKDSMESDLLHPGESEQYVWDDLSLPHKLVVQIVGVDMPALREINIDKICSWKPFSKMHQNKGFGLDFSFNKGLSLGKRNSDALFGLRMPRMGYEVYADGLTRVLCICEHTDTSQIGKIQGPIANLQFRIYYICMHLLEQKEQNVEEPQSVSTILTMRLGHISIDSVITNRYKHLSAAIQSINVDEKWEGASFGSILRRSQLDNASLSENILHVIFILNSTNSSVKQVKYCSIILQPIDLKVDEETLMKLVPFWRTSLAASGTPSTQFYFRHFEVHPIKIVTSFRPGSPHITYSSAQEALRALLHSVMKVPVITNSVVELNGVLLSHALVTFRELLLKCAQHYSWYILRALYVTKGSSLLPPSFASIFDDSASSVLDVFFDPSDGSVNLPGLTIGMFKFMRKNMKSAGFSGTKRYFGDLGKTVKTASSNALFAAVTEVSDSIVRGAETNGFNGMVTGFHHGILRLAMEPSVLGLAIMEGGPDREIKLDRSPGLDELYIEGYLQAMLDVVYKQEYLRVRVIDDQVVLKNLPPNTSLINEIVENVKSFLVSKALLKGDTSTIRPLRHLRKETEWRVGPTVLTLCEHLFVSFAVRALHREANKVISGIIAKGKASSGHEGEPSSSSSGSPSKPGILWNIGRFAVSGMVAYVDGRLCRHIPDPIARRIVSGFLLSFIDRKDDE